MSTSTITASWKVTIQISHGLNHVFFLNVEDIFTRGSFTLELGQGYIKQKDLSTSTAVFFCSSLGDDWYNILETLICSWFFYALSIWPLTQGDQDVSSFMISILTGKHQIHSVALFMGTLILRWVTWGDNKRGCWRVKLLEGKFWSACYRRGCKEVPCYFDRSWSVVIWSEGYYFNLGFSMHIRHEIIS